MCNIFCNAFNFDKKLKLKCNFLLFDQVISAKSCINVFCNEATEYETLLVNARSVQKCLFFQEGHFCHTEN
jgi:hypothetical protein